MNAGKHRADRFVDLCRYGAQVSPCENCAKHLPRHRAEVAS